MIAQKRRDREHCHYTDPKLYPFQPTLATKVDFNWPTLSIALESTVYPNQPTKARVNAFCPTTTTNCHHAQKERHAQPTVGVFERLGSTQRPLHSQYLQVTPALTTIGKTTLNSSRPPDITPSKTNSSLPPPRRGPCSREKKWQFHQD